MKKLLLALLFTIMIVSPLNAQSTLPQQEKCAEGAKKFFLEFKNQHPIDFLGAYTCHYNKKLDKCFIRIIWDNLPKDIKEPRRSGIEIYDVFEEIRYGYWNKFDGNKSGMVGKKSCNSFEEFENLIKPYMEE